MTGTKVSKEFAAEMVLLAEAWSSALTETKILVYAEALSDLSIGDMRAARVRAVRECKFFPSPAELRSFVVPSADDAGMIAWTALCRAAADVGGYSSLEVDDAQAAAAVVTVFGGWPQFCEQCEADGGWGQKRQSFLTAYRQARRQATGREPVGRLPGLCEGGGPADRASWTGRISRSGAVLQVPPDRTLPARKEVRTDEASGRPVAGHLSERAGSAGPAAAEEPERDAEAAEGSQAQKGTQRHRQRPRGGRDS